MGMVRGAPLGELCILQTIAYIRFLMSIGAQLMRTQSIHILVHMLIIIRLRSVCALLMPALRVVIVSTPILLATAHTLWLTVHALLRTAMSRAISWILIVKQLTCQPEADIVTVTCHVDIMIVALIKAIERIIPLFRHLMCGVLLTPCQGGILW